MDQSSHGASASDAGAPSSLTCEECGTQLVPIERPDYRYQVGKLYCPNVGWDDDSREPLCSRSGMAEEPFLVEPAPRPRATREATRTRHAEEAVSIAAAAAGMTIQDVPRFGHGVPPSEQDDRRASVLASYRKLAAYMAERGTTRWSESERRWGHVLGLSRKAAMRHLVRMRAFRWIELDKRPITEQVGRYVKPTVKRHGDGFVTTTGGQTRVRLLPRDD